MNKRLTVLTVSEVRKHLPELVSSGDTIEIKKYKDTVAWLVPAKDYKTFIKNQEMLDKYDFQTAVNNEFALREILRAKGFNPSLELERFFEEVEMTDLPLPKKKENAIDKLIASGKLGMASDFNRS